MDLPGNDRQLTLLHLRKTFSAYLKEDLTGHDQQIAAFDRLLPLFNRIMSMYTPDELAVQFKEILSFCHQLCHLLVHEIRRRANIENTREAATSVYDLLRPSPPDSRGWVILKSITFIVNSGVPKVMDPVCKSMLPSTLVKLVYLFFDLPPLESGPENGKNAQEADLRSRLYDSLVTLMNSLCAYTAVAEELIQKDDLVLLFVGASSTSPLAEHTVWRDANFTFLCTIVSKALSSAVVKYIHSKGCIGHYLKNVRSADLSQQEKVVLLGNMLDLLRSSAETTRVLIDDFGSANGYQTIVEFCCSSQTTMEECGQVFHALSGLITAGDETVQFNQPATQLSFYNFKLPQTLSRSTATVRVPDAYLVLEKCFYDGNDELCLLVLDLVSKLYKSERMNYFIVDKYYSLYLLVERMVAKGHPVQQKVLELVEFVLRELNFIPCKELTALSVHIKRAISSKDYDTLEQWLNFLFKILPININVKDAFRELSILEILLYIVQKAVLNESEEPEAMKKDDHPKKWFTTQMAMDLLVVATKGNVLNAQFVTENLEMRTIKAILVESKDSDQRISEELRTAILVLIKNLLYLAKNEQLFSSLLQLLFSDPGNIPMCSIILKLFTTVLLESHKVRIMFRKSGGYICLMTLLLHLEGALLSKRDKAQETLKNLNSDASSSQHQPSRHEILTHIAMIFHVFVVSMRYEPSNAKYFLTEVSGGYDVPV